jgi:hypothetical protein
MSASSKRTFETKEDVKRWKKNPTIHPITGVVITDSSQEYQELYLKAYQILEQITDDIAPLLPKEHLLFGDIDLLYYMLKGESYNPSTESISELFLISITNFRQQESKLKTEIEWLKNLVSKKPIFQEIDGVNYEFNSLHALTIHINEHIQYIIKVLCKETFDYKTTNLNVIKNSNPEPRGKDLIYFMEKNKLQNGMIIMDYLKEQSNLSWSRDFLILLNRYISVYLDINDLLYPKSGIIENYENIRFDPIPDPIEKYFSEYETELKKIKDPKFSRLIDITTFKPIDKNVYLNDQQYTEFNKKYKKAEIEYKTLRTQYENDYDEYIKNKQTSKSDKSKSDKSKSGPKMPKRPIIVYGNGLEYTYGNIPPTHISNELLRQFNTEYKKVEETIEKYNELKNTPYSELIKYEPKSKKIVKGNKLFTMSRKEINDNILYDGNNLENKCSEPTDILTGNAFNEDNYPLAALQLMVRLRIYDKGKYKTECIYAPSLYNYFVDCVKKQKPFINPKNRQEYTKRHIKELITVMNIVDRNITVPYYVKHMNDKKLVINLKRETLVFAEYEEFINMIGWNDITEIIFYKIGVYRKFGEDNYLMFNICCIPEGLDIADTGSSTLTSEVMLLNIITLFEEGKLLSSYVPPYYTFVDNIKQRIKLPIRFNEYNTEYHWLFNRHTEKTLTRKEYIDKFKEFAQEINSIA